MSFSVFQNPSQELVVIMTAFNELTQFKVMWKIVVTLESDERLIDGLEVVFVALSCMGICLFLEI